MDLLCVAARAICFGFCWQLATDHWQLANSLLFEQLVSKNRLKAFHPRNIRRFFLNSLLIPCFCALKSRKPAIHAAFRVGSKKIPCYFPCFF